MPRSRLQPFRLHRVQKTKSTLPALQWERLERVSGILLRLPVPSEATVVFASNADMRRYNKRHRSKDTTTDVLSFPLHSKRPFPKNSDGVCYLGDMFISPTVAKKQAQARGATIREELRELLVHGILHLVGYDHMHPHERRQMQKKAEEILTKW